MTPPNDERWALLADLRARLAPDARPWEPLSIVGLNYWADIVDEAGFVRVGIEFDYRMSLDRVIEELRKIWPEIRRRGVVRRTRPLGPRAVALLRHVCLDSPIDATWRARWESWEKEHPEWHYAGPSQFNTAFHRAELQLAGRPGAYAPFYDSDAAARRASEDDAWLALAEEDFAAAWRHLEVPGEGPPTVEQLLSYAAWLQDELAEGAIFRPSFEPVDRLERLAEHIAHIEEELGVRTDE